MRVIKINGLLDIELDTSYPIGYEYIEPYHTTLIYCFSVNSKWINRLLSILQNRFEVTLLPQTYHDIFYKRYYYQPIEVVSPNHSEIKLFDHIQMMNKEWVIFFEMNIKRRRIQTKISFQTIDELKYRLVVDYHVHYLIPFFYSNREMKEFKQEKRIKIKDLNLLYVLENKTLEGKKR